jgi:hypothetical protein
LEAEIVFDDIAYSGGMTAFCRIDYTHPVNNLGDFRRCERTRGRLPGGKEADDSDDN